MRQHMMKKLRSRAGESIGETLVALLISALALMMLAGAISAAMRVVTSSTDKMNEYYAADNQIVTAGTADANQGTTNVQLTEQAPGTMSFAYSVKYYSNDQFSRNTVVTYVKEESATPAGSGGDGAGAGGEG